MTFFILTLFQTGYKLRTSTLYHLLVGKRTSSVLLHGFFYKNLAYLGALPNLKEETFQKELQQLINQKLIVVDDGFGRMTKEGEKLLTSDFFDLSGLNNLRYGRMRENSWQMILFAVQVVSNLSFNENDYLPIENRPYYLQQIKKWLATSQPNLIRKFYQELTSILKELPQVEADFLANQFSGYGFQGKTAFQLFPDKWQEFPWNILYRQRAIDLFFAQIEDGEISRLLLRLDQQNINQSMLKTKEFFLAGKTMNEILELRHLKQGTINDHFIEWGLMDKDFPYERFERVDFSALNEEQVIHAHYQDYEVPYLTFRLSQLYYLRRKQWS
ncbi:helix-turn-helix domain-containing protein [Enterococcus sp. AZ196]|uniref:helix-turn-helix domain-containing protein n=1 Tax=Enterococcus sp. AZ196 TaxID=2774659 RepID=UPI003D2C2672